MGIAHHLDNATLMSLAAGALPAALWAGAAAHAAMCARCRRLGFGMWHQRLPLEAGGALLLLKAAPGREVPEPGHGGAEPTLGLRGSHDATGRYRVGEAADLDDTVEHQRGASPGPDCVCLMASKTPARFGRIARLMQPRHGL